MINAERRSKGAPPLRQSPALSRVAQWHTGVISRQDRLSTGSREDLRNQMKRAGYQAHKWTESVATSPGGAATVPFLGTGYASSTASGFSPSESACGSPGFFFFGSSDAKNFLICANVPTIS